MTRKTSKQSPKRQYWRVKNQRRKTYLQYLWLHGNRLNQNPEAPIITWRLHSHVKRIHLLHIIRLKNRCHSNFSAASFEKILKLHRTVMFTSRVVTWIDETLWKINTAWLKSSKSYFIRRTSGGKKAWKVGIVCFAYMQNFIHLTVMQKK